jgi:hypothetical protein
MSKALIYVVVHENTQKVGSIITMLNRVQMPGIYTNRNLHDASKYTNPVLMLDEDMNRVTDPDKITVVIIGPEEKFNDYHEFIKLAVSGHFVENHRCFKDFSTPVTKSLPSLTKREYSYHSEMYLGWMICTVERPFTVDPFTVVIKSYIETGIKPLFPALFQDSDWGLLKGDYDFLEKLWDHYKFTEKLEGDFSVEKMEEIMKEYRCIYVAPELYRKPMQQVKHILDRSLPLEKELPIDKRNKIE